MIFAYTIFAEKTAVSQDGRFDVVGMDLAALEFTDPPPWVQPELVFLTSVHFASSEQGRTFRFSGDFLNPEGKEMGGPHIEGEFRAPTVGRSHRSRMILVMHLSQITFPEPGVYRMVITIEDAKEKFPVTKVVELPVLQAPKEPTSI